MSSLTLDSFGGIAPILSPRKLSAALSVAASDCKFEGSDLRGLFAHTQQQTLGFNVARLFKYRAMNTWLAWPDPYVVDVVPSPIAADSLQRLYWTRANPADNSSNSDQYPRCASQPTQTDIINNTSVIRRLGVPAPTTAPAIAGARAGDVFVRPVTMSQTSPVHVTTATAHPFKEGQRVSVAFSGTVVERTNMSEINGLEFVIANVTAQAFDLRGSDGANYSAMTNASVIKITRVFEDSDYETRSYVFTLVTDWGEEGPPSPPSDPINIIRESQASVICAWNGTAGFGGINRVRVYRTLVGASGNAEFYYVDEKATGAGSGNGSVTVTDNKTEIQLGEPLPSATWALPPNKLQGLVQMPNGFLAGFVGNTIYFSEPYLPHAWPFEYTKTTLDEIVGMAVYGQTLVVATKSKPYLATGTDPASVSLQQLDIDAPCLNKGGVCSVGSGVAYPAPDGLAVVNAAGPKIVTGDNFSRVQWAAAWSLTADAIYHDGRYIAFSRESNKPTLLIEIANGKLNISTLSTIARSPAIDLDDDTLQFIVNGRSRTKFEGGSVIAPYMWKSRIFTMPHAINFSAGQVYATTYPITISVAFANLANPDGQPAQGLPPQSFDVTVAGPEPFRLPGGYMSREWQVTLTGTAQIQGVRLTDNMDELRE